MAEDASIQEGGGALPQPSFPIRGGEVTPPPDPFAPKPTLAQTGMAQLRQLNPIVSVIDAVSSMPGNEPTPGYNPLDTIKGTPHEGDDLSMYAGSHNEAYTRALMARKDREDEDRRTVAAAGWPGVAMGIGAGLLDPTLLIPVLGEERIGKIGAMAAYSAAQVEVSETALQTSQVARPWQESAGNIASATILGGVLGRAAEYLSKTELAEATKALDDIRPRVDAATGDLIMPPPGNMLSAAQTDIRQLLLKSGLGVEKISGIRKADLESPNLAIYNASSVEGRRAMRDVSEFGGLFKDAGEGQTAPFGSPLESQARVLKGQAMVNTNKIVEDAWFQHYGAEEKQGTVKGFLMKQGVGAPTTADKLGFGDFDRAVGAAMSNGDAHSIPEVQAAAEKLRSGVADPIKEALQNTKDRDGKPMLGDELDAPKGAKSFFPLIYNRDAWIARRPENERMLTDYYESEQAIKAATKERLQDLSERRAKLAERIGPIGELVSEIAGPAGRDADPFIKEGLIADHAAIGAKIEEEIKNWKGNTTREAVAALKKRDLAAQTGSSAGTKPAADAVDAAVRRILASDRDLSRQELASRAQQTVDRIIGSPDGRLAYDDAGTFGFKGGSEDARGSLLARRMPIDVNELISRGLVNTSATHGMASLARTLIPDMLLTKRFGDVGMTDTFRRIDEEYAAKAGANEKANAKLNNEKNAVIENLAAARDRLRGVYGWDPSPLSQRHTAMVRDMQNINALRALGTSVANRLTDSVNAVFRYGLMNVFKDAWGPLFEGLMNPEILKIARDQARDAAVGVDGLLGHMRQNIHDVNTAMDPGNKFSRGLAYAADKSMIANLHGPWTDWNKILVFNVAQGELGRVVARVAADKATKRDLAYLDGVSIDRAMAGRIAGQYDQHAVIVSGRKFADAPNWTDRGAKMAFEAAMTREANATVLTAGIGQRPLLMDKNLGRLGLQFTSFKAAAHENVLLSSLQKRDMRTVEGVLSAVAMGMIGTALYKIASGQEISSDPRDWVKEGLDRSAMTGWFGEANNHLSRLTSGSIDYNRLYGAQTTLTRHRDLSLEGELGGPTVDLAEKLARAGEHAVAGRSSTGQPSFTGTDVHNIRQGLPLQNLWAFRRLLDQVEESASNAFGLKPRPKQAVH
jgi:hypothetical protein